MRTTSEVRFRRNHICQSSLSAVFIGVVEAYYSPYAGFRVLQKCVVLQEDTVYLIELSPRKLELYPIVSFSVPSYLDPSKKRDDAMRLYNWLLVD
jgi:hypothetical protein